MEETYLRDIRNQLIINAAMALRDEIELAESPKDIEEYGEIMGTGSRRERLTELASVRIATERMDRFGSVIDSFMR